jgi:hypothetical protein
MNRYRIVYRQAWRTDTAAEITPDPTVLHADGFAEGPYGVSFFRNNPDRRPDEPDVIYWIPLDVIRLVKLEPADDE